MKNLILFLSVADLMIFIFANKQVMTVNRALQYTFLVYDKAGYKHEIYKPVKATIILKMVEVTDNIPSFTWEKKLFENISLYDLPGRSNPIIRKFNIGSVTREAYFVYKINYKHDSSVSTIEKAIHIDRSERSLYIGL